MASPKKSKLPTQPKRLDGPQKISELPTSITTDIEFAIEDKEYKPAESADKYPHIKTPEYLYKILASRGDYVKLQEEVTSHLNDGWSLAGGLSVAVQTDHYSASTIFAQAIFKTK
jgi:hypothetical protein